MQNSEVDIHQVCLQRGPEYYDYKLFKPQYKYLHLLSSDHNRYEIGSMLGYGKYSNVYDGWDTVEDRRVVIKVLKPLEQEKLNREIKILWDLREFSEIVGLKDICIDRDVHLHFLVTYNRLI